MLTARDALIMVIERHGDLTSMEFLIEKAQKLKSLLLFSKTFHTNLRHAHEPNGEKLVKKKKNPC